MKSKKRLQWKRFILSHIRRSNVSVLNKSVNDGENPICTEMVDAGVDWIPRTILDALVEKAVQQNASTAVPSNISNHVFSNSNGIATTSNIIKGAAVFSRQTPALQFQAISQTPRLLQPRPTSSQQQPTTPLQLPPATYQSLVSCLQPQYPCFPSPNIGQFLIYLLQFCPRQTSTCFGCGQPLKNGTQIRIAPNDKVIVSKMTREFSYNGTPQNKLAKMKC